uniref:leucine-rich repeat domain-containing protein n=1 Tax=uncultured Clostridium sp. TaxID=59620 RepID=UPI00262DE446
MKERKNKVTAMAMATTIAVTTMAPVQTTTVYAQELDKPPIEAKVNEENKEQEVTKVEALKSENKGAVESNKETNIVEDEKKEESINNKEKEESTSNKENNEDKVKEEEKENTEEKDKEDNQDNKENLDENTKVEDQEKKEEAEIKEGNEGNEALGNTENKSESEKVDDKTLESVEEVENKDLSKVEENKESGEKEKAGGVVFDSKNFPDEEFRKYLKNEHGFTEGQALSEDEINAVKFINVWNMTISDLKGIEYFRNLEYLDCDSTRITSLDVSKNTALEYLDCRDTGITSLDVSQNTDLEYLNCNGTPITSLDVSQNTALEELYCRDTGITSLDVSKNTALLGLYCSDTGITSLDVSNNTALEYLNCNGTPITSLDVSNNTALLGLYCIDTGITNLDVSNNAALEYLICNDTGITNLDVSKNTALLVLACQGAPLTGLNLGNNNNLDLYIDSLNKEVTLTVTSQSFNTIDKLGCKGSEISELKGAQLDKDNNIMTIESMANKITYKYNCGTAKGNPVYLNVTLNLEKGSSTIEVNELDRAYTGNPVNLIKDQDYTITGSEGNVTLTYYKRNSNGGFDKINEATEVGDYKVKIDLNGTDYCNGTQVEKEFKIEKATNTWKDELSIKGWTYGETPKKPTASAQFGNVEFSYSSSENGEFSSTVPTTGGTWYVKAEVVGNDNYTGISDVKEFTIKKAIPNYSIPQDIKATYGQTLKDI